jgi:hypothetical protein
MGRNVLIFVSLAILIGSVIFITLWPTWGPKRIERPDNVAVAPKEEPVQKANPQESQEIEIAKRVEEVEKLRQLQDRQQPDLSKLDEGKQASSRREELARHAAAERRQRAAAETRKIVKKDCERLVDGQLVFEPAKIMRQGKPYPVFTRLSRNPGVKITAGLDGTDFVIVKETVSCRVSVSLASEEKDAFTIEKQPPDRKDEQFLESDKFSQWDWLVTPRKHGTLHLLLYVTPMLYVDGIGEGEKEFKQAPRVITVTSDYVYESGVFLRSNWGIVGGLLTAVVIPLFLWFRREITDWLTKRYRAKRKMVIAP